MVGESVFVKVRTEGEVTTLYWYLMLEGLELLLWNREHLMMYFKTESEIILKME